MTKPWVIYGCRSPYVAEIAEIIWRNGDSIEFMVDNRPSLEAVRGTASVKAVADLRPNHLGTAVLVPFTTPGHRFSAYKEAESVGFGNFAALVDPTAVVASTASIGDGVVVNAAVAIGAYTTLGEFVSINRSASVGHDCTIEGFVTIGPAAVLGGHVVLERGSYIATGAVVAPGVKVGANAVVGAGAVVVRDVASYAVVVGNPAKVLRIGEEGYGGVSPGP